MSRADEERAAELLALRESDPEVGSGWLELSEDLRHLLGHCATVERDLAGLALASRGHPSSAGPYRLLRPLGRGDAGTVYLAESSEDGARVALRVLEEPGVEAVSRVARRISGWRHPGVLAVVAAEDCWLASELSRGIPLSGVLPVLFRRSPTGRRDAARLLLRALAVAARGLAEAHARGFVHGGIAPDKLDLDPGGRVRLRDFGFDPLRGGRPPTPGHPPSAIPTTSHRRGSIPQTSSPRPTSTPSPPSRTGSRPAVPPTRRAA